MTEYVLRVACGRSPEELFPVLRHFESFSGWSARIRSVSVDAGTSRWAVSFRTGLVRWTQQDVIHEAEHRIDFEQISGDFVTFTGQWAVEGDRPGSTVTYRVSFRTSVPHLAGAIDPMVARTLLHAALDVVTAIAGDTDILSGADLLNDPHPAIR